MTVTSEWVMAACAILMPDVVVFENWRPVFATGNLADPVCGVPCRRCHGSRRQPTRQQAEKVPPTALDGVMGVSIALMEVMFAQIGLEADVSWHAPVLSEFALVRAGWGHRWGQRPRV
jgi:hypothetical protein